MVLPATAGVGVTAYLLIVYEDDLYGVYVMGEVTAPGWPTPERCDVVGTAEECGRWLANHLGIVL